MRQVWVWGFVAVLAAGALFRLIWPGDIEYKIDEAWTFARARDWVEGGEAAALGMPSSQKVRNPALSVWAFYPVGGVFGASDPPELARGVAVLSVAALVLLALFAWQREGEEREWWLWGVALAAVNPLAVLLQRKIWPPSLYPLLLVGLLACWWHRERRWGAFGWGLIGPLLGQIHLSGFFHAAALAGWTFLFDRRRVRWGTYLAGAAVGCLPLLPWLSYLAGAPERVQDSAFEVRRIVGGKFWLTWLTEAFGLTTGYALGEGEDAFLDGPFVGGVASGGLALLRLASCGLLLGLVGVRLAQWLRQRPRLVEWLSGRGSSTGLLLGAVFWGYGLLLSLTGLPVYRHYLMIAFPLVAVWTARLALPPGALAAARSRGRAVLASLCLAGLLTTASLLAHLHEHGGAPAGDYGPSYAAQARDGWLTPRHEHRPLAPDWLPSALVRAGESKK